MADKIVIECEDYDKYRLYWWLEEDGDIGGAVGDYDASQEKYDKTLEKIRESWPPREELVETLECCGADLRARDTAGAQKDSLGYYWTSKAQVTQALREVKQALRAVRVEMKTGRKEPDWAIKARAAGWKAPKGWTP